MGTENSDTTTEITPRDHDQSWGRVSGNRHTFRLHLFRGRVLEVEDVHFHFDSAVMMPDVGTCASIADEADANHISGLAVIRACYLHAERMPSNVLLITGHTDRSGSDAYNLELSRLRADNVYDVLMGERGTAGEPRAPGSARQTWIKICHQKHQTEDIQQILIWVTATFGWDCDPGPKNNVMNYQTTAAIRRFQETYNEHYDPDIGVDGSVGEETWGAFFDMYMEGLKRLMRTDDAGLATNRSRITYLDSSQPTHGCGENHPVTEDRIENTRSRIDRRVHILFFDPPATPRMDCHPSRERCNPNVCEIYGRNRIFRFEPLPCDPTDVGRRYRIRLELGDINRLFDNIGSSAATDTGIRQRLQAIGFLYEPLNSTDITAIASDAWDHFKTVISVADDATAAERLQQMVRDIIVDSNTLPGEGDFTRVRYPGTYCLTQADLNAGFFGDPSGGQHSRYELEQSVWDANASLGLIPVVAIVEERNGEAWHPAPQGLQLHFQLLEPDAPAAGSAVVPPALRTTTVTSTNSNDATPPVPPNVTFNMTGSPHAYVDNERTRNAITPNDPQVDNTHQQVGGKRGRAVAGNDRMQNILETDTSRPTFHTHFNFNVPSTSSHSNAVMTQTNADGRAAVVFMPARTGGDRYKIRAFLDPVVEPGNDQASDGTEAFAVRADTGTMVVWRILRLSKYMRWNYPGAGVDPNHAIHFTRGNGNLNNFDTTGVISTEYSRAWLDVTVENLAQSPQNITQAQWRQAIQFARPRINTAGMSQNYDINTILPDTTATAGVNNNSSGLIRFRTAAQYDAAKPAAMPNAVGNASFLSDMGRLMHAMSAEIMHFFTRNAISGVTVIQCPQMTSIEADTPSATLSGDASRNNWNRSGWGGMRRGCYVVFGNGTYSSAGFPYDHNRNTMHETGHTLYCPHQYTQTTQVNTGAGGSTGTVFDEHDYHDLCVMGYMNLRPNGDFCGRCALLFAGRETHGMPANNPGP